MSFVRPRAWLSRFRQLRKKHVLMSLGAVVLCAGLGMVTFQFAHAQGSITSLLGVSIAQLLSWVFLGLGSILGSITTLLITVLLSLAQYNGFINALPVQIGWVVMRDIANLFFIVILLVIAFGTILGLEKYNYRALLKDFIVMAIAVNFSRTIVGLVIDISQVIMLTFVNGFAAAAAGNFINALRLDSLFKYTTENIAETTAAAEIGTSNTALGEAMSTLGAIFLGFLITVVVFITILAFVAVLMYRIVMLWIVTILSPLAFFLKTFPQGQNYYAEWWSKLKSAAQAGPILAFFLWLALVIAAQTNDNILAGGQSGKDALPSIKIFDSAIGVTDSITGLIITLAILFLGLESVQKLGDGFGGIAGWASGNAKNWIKNFTTKPAAFVGKGAAFVGKGIAQTADEAYGAKTGTKISESILNIPFTYKKYRKELTDNLKKKEDLVKGEKEYKEAERGYTAAVETGDAAKIGKARIALEEKKAANQKALKASRDEYDVVGKEEDKMKLEERHSNTLAAGAQRAKEQQEAIARDNANNTNKINNRAKRVGGNTNPDIVAGQDASEPRDNLETVYNGMPQQSEVLARFDRDMKAQSDKLTDSRLGRDVRAAAELFVGGDTHENRILAAGDMANQFKAEMQGARGDIDTIFQGAILAQDDEMKRSALQVIGENLADSLQEVMGSMGYESTRDGARNFLADKLLDGDYNSRQTVLPDLTTDLAQIKAKYDAAVMAAGRDDAALRRARQMRNESVLNAVAQERERNQSFDMSALRMGRNLNTEQRGQLNQSLRTFNDRDNTMRDNHMYYRYARNVTGTDALGNRVNLADLANAQQDRMNNRDAANKVAEDLSGLHATVANQIHQEVKNSVHYSNEINITAQADKEREYKEAAAKAVQGSLDYDVLLNRMRDDKKSSDAVLLAKINKTLGGFNLSLGEIQQALRDKEKFKEIFNRITKDSGAPEDVKKAQEDAVRNALSYMAQSLQ